MPSKLFFITYQLADRIIFNDIVPRAPARIRQCSALARRPELNYRVHVRTAKAKGLPLQVTATDQLSYLVASIHALLVTRLANPLNLMTIVRMTVY